MMDENELADAVGTLTAAVQDLSDRLDTQQSMIDAIKKQARDIRATRMVLAAAVFGIILDLALTVGFAVLYHQVEKNQRLTQQVQARTSTVVLCPLYEWLTLSMRLNPPPEAATPQQVQLRQTAADTITHGLTTLGCQP